MPRCPNYNLSLPPSNPTAIALSKQTHQQQNHQNNTKTNVINSNSTSILVENSTHRTPLNGSSQNDHKRKIFSSNSNIINSAQLAGNTGRNRVTGNNCSNREEENIIVEENSLAFFGVVYILHFLDIAASAKMHRLTDRQVTSLPFDSNNNFIYKKNSQNNLYLQPASLKREILKRQLRGAE